jgi:hypothetical protein
MIGASSFLDLEKDLVLKGSFTYRPQQVLSVYQPLESTTGNPFPPLCRALGVTVPQSRNHGHKTRKTTMKQLFAIRSSFLSLARSNCRQGARPVARGRAPAPEAQKAIILHNAAEEARSEDQLNHPGNQILEFIPFPSAGSEPGKGVTLSGGRHADNGKGLFLHPLLRGSSRGSGKGYGPVEIRLSKKNRVHDVTVVKINAIASL